MDTWRRCEDTGDAILDYEDDDGAVIPIRVPWEHRHTSIGWGRRTRASWVDPETRETRSGLITQEGPAGVMRR